MIKEVKYSECKFSFEYQGDEGIYVTTLKNSIGDVVNILQEITKTQEPEAYVKLKITKFDTGSFDIDFLAIVEQANNLLNHTDKTAAIMVSIFSSVFAIKQFLKGDKPKEIEKGEDETKIVNHKDEEMIVASKIADTYFNTPNIDKLVVNIFNTVDKEEGKNGLVIKDELNNCIKIPKEDFSNMKKNIIKEEKHEENNDVLINTIKTDLLIRKPDLTGKSQWGFILDKNIDASIEDEKWIKKVHKEKLSFAPGDRLPVELRIEVELDQSGDIIKGSEKYIITEVTGDVIHEINYDQMKLS